MKISIVIAQEEHFKYAEKICDTIETSALLRGTGIAKRTPEYIKKKIGAGDAVIALDKNGVFAGFCYMNSALCKIFIVGQIYICLAMLVLVSLLPGGV